MYRQAAMVHLLRRGELPNSPRRTVRFEGEPYRAGRVAITADGCEVEAGPGDVAVVEAGAPHRFRNLGPGRLELVCSHAAGRMFTEWLDAPWR